MINYVVVFPLAFLDVFVVSKDEECRDDRNVTQVESLKFVANWPTFDIFEIKLFATRELTKRPGNLFGVCEKDEGVASSSPNCACQHPKAIALEFGLKAKGYIMYYVHCIRQIFEYLFMEVIYVLFCVATPDR